MKKVKIGLFIFLSVILLSACSLFKPDKPDTFDWPVADFTFSNQDNQSFGLSDLLGQVWVANFFFTHCTTVCPIETGHMAELQRKVKAAGVNAQLVSFTVDPSRDDAETVKEYAGRYSADFSSWNFLTGYTFEQIQEISEKSFKTILLAPPDDSDQFVHGTSFFLVNQEGIVLEAYNGTGDTPYDQIVKDVKSLK